MIRTPNLPDENISLAIIDFRCDKNTLKCLNGRGIKTIKTQNLEFLMPSECGHPDMQLCNLGEGCIITAPAAYNYYCRIPQLSNYKILKGETILTSTYPNNIAYNVARVGEIAFHNTKYTDIMIKNYFKKHDISLIHVNQGYTKCSTCIVSEDSIITSDIGIYNAALENKIDALLITPGYIELDAKNYGFIGGCTFKINKNTLAVNGTLKLHPDYNIIINFLRKYNIQLLELSEFKAFDIGSVIPL